jgi:cell division protein ZapA (FtsZ GTPase activity inhibitor)
VTYRDGSVVEVQVRAKQGMANVMDEKKALERAAELISDRLGELGAGPSGAS